VTDDQVTPRQIDAFKRFMKFLSPDQDLTLVILKGHLLIEEQIREIIAERVKRPDVLEAEDVRRRIGFDVATYIAEAFFPKELEPWLWKAARKLNTVRNAIGHSVEPRNLDTKIDDFVDSVGAGLDLRGDRQGRFEGALFSLFEAVSSLVARHGTK
jgi:hypothetical protein